MKKIIILIFLIFVFVALGCKKEEAVNSQGKKVVEINFDLYPIEKNGKWGFINSSGKWVIKPKFKKVKNFSKNGLAAVKKDNKWGYINTKGEWAIKPKFEYACYFNAEITSVIYNDKLGFIDKKGEWIIEPKIDIPNYYCRNFRRNKFEEVSINNSWGCINTKGKWIVKPKFDYVVYDRFHNVIFIKLNKKKGIMDMNGKWIIKPNYDNIDIYNNTITATVNNKTGVMDMNGKWIIKPNYDNIDIYTNTITATVNNKTGVMDMNGKWIIKPKFEKIFGFYKNGLAHVKIHNKHGVIDKKNHWIVEPKYEDIDIYHKIILATLNNRTGIINTKGKWIVKPKFNKLKIDDNKNYLIANINDKWGCINLKGDWVLQPVYDKINNCNINKLSVVAKNNKFGIINERGKWLIKPKFEDIVFRADKGNLFFVWDNHKIGLIDKEGNWVKKPIFEEIDGFYENGLAIVKINKKYGVIDKKGNWILKPKFDRGIRFIGNLIMVEYGNNMGYTTLNGKYLTFSENDIKNYYAGKRLYLNKYLTIKEGSIVFLPLTPELKRVLKTNKNYIKFKIEECSKSIVCDAYYEDNKIRIYIGIEVDKKYVNKINKGLIVIVDINTEKDYLGLEASYYPSKLDMDFYKKANIPISLIGKTFSFNNGKAIMPKAIFIDVKEQTVASILEDYNKMKASWHPPYLIEGTNCVDFDDARNGEWISEAYRKGGILDSKGCLIAK